MDWLKKRPFRPFLLQISDGHDYEITHPDQALPTRSSVNVLPRDPNRMDEDAEDADAVALIHITRITPLSRN
jgi:hypothetical protein